MDGFLAFRPDAPELEGLISGFDLNCAVSTPNALYGTRFNDNPPETPRIQLAESSVFSSFALVSVDIKPLNMPPLGHAKLTLRAGRFDQPPLEWSVDFPHGFHTMFKVKIEEFSGEQWTALRNLQITADFVNGGRCMDWEFCLDNLHIIFER